MNLTVANHFRTIHTAAEQVGAKLPTNVLEAWERSNRITEAVEQLYPPQGALVTAVIAALDADRDPATDKTVQRVLTAQRLGSSSGPVHNGARTVLDADLVRVLRANVDGILTALAGPFNAAAATLAACHARLGDVDLDDTTTIVRQGGDAAAVWAEARAAVTVIERVDLAWSTLAMATMFAPVGGNHAALRITEATAEQWHSLDELRRSRVNPWFVVRAGLPLTLASGADYARRIEAVHPQPDPDEARRQRSTIGTPAEQARRIAAVRRLATL
ncbi:hypothetical protein [Geodermatophilus sp. SYSU D01105]